METREQIDFDLFFKTEYDIKLLVSFPQLNCCVISRNNIYTVYEKRNENC